MLLNASNTVSFTPGELDGVHGLTAEAGWPHRVEDLALTLALSEGRVALEAGRVVGAALCTPFGDHDATINTIVVARSWRGQGLGRALTRWALDRASSRTCRLVATEQGRPLYETLGFDAAGTISQHQGTLGAAAQGEASWAEPFEQEQIACLDEEASGMDRSALIAGLARVGRFAVLRRSGRVAGFACVRRFGRGFVAGPVAADDEANAEALLGAVFAAHSGQFMRVDTGAAALRPFLEAHGLACVDTGTSMRRGAERGRPGALQCFALASQALG